VWLTFALFHGDWFGLERSGVDPDRFFLWCACRAKRPVSVQPTGRIGRTGQGRLPEETVHLRPVSWCAPRGGFLLGGVVVFPASQTGKYRSR
jgi:hypothetical protein